MQSNYIHQAQMIVHFTSQQSDAKFTVRCGASSSLHNPSLLSRQQISHTNFGRIVTRMCYAVTGPVSSGLLLVSLWCCGSDCCRVCCTDVTVTTPQPRGDNSTIPTATTTSVACTGTAATTQRPSVSTKPSSSAEDLSESG